MQQKRTQKPHDAKPLPKICEDINLHQNGEILPPAAAAVQLQRLRQQQEWEQVQQDNG